MRGDKHVKKLQNQCKQKTAANPPQIAVMSITSIPMPSRCDFETIVFHKHLIVNLTFKAQSQAFLATLLLAWMNPLSLFAYMPQVEHS
ncbi:hypothetical protein YC2023_049637 [Brassica napus]